MTSQAFIREVVGGTISEFHRVHYVYDGQIEDEEIGPVELVLGSGSRWTFRDIDGGMVLKVREGAWRDPFGDTGPPSEFIDEFGKWTRFDVSDTEPYRYFVGRPVQRGVIYARDDNTAGLELAVEERIISIFAAADECHVVWESLETRVETLHLHRVFSHPE